ncbi:MAG: hypothetical protein J7K21_00920 [Desulfurococcales archaeon]|nr:hypothetical protein [Desulfurococcales archaeon]
MCTLKTRLNPEEKEFFKKIIPALIQKIEFIEKEFPFEKTIGMDLTVRALRVRVKPKKWLDKETWKQYARKYGWKGAFVLDDENIKSPKAYLSAKFSAMLQDVGASIFDVKREHLEKILEELNKL